MPQVGKVRAIPVGQPRIGSLDRTPEKREPKTILQLTQRCASVKKMPPKPPNPHAQALGKLAAKARMKKLTAKQRAEYARIAGRARWKNLSAAERSELAARGGRASKGVKKKTRRK